MITAKPTSCVARILKIPTVDSIKVDFNKINKMYPEFRTFSFENNAKVQELLQKEYLMNKAEIVNSKIYLDPLHDYAPRKLEVRDNGNIVIIGMSLLGKVRIVAKVLGALAKTKNKTSGSKNARYVL